jgi:hypothetical protein
MKQPVLFYHIAQMEGWKAIVTEQLELLAKAGFDGTLLIGMCGPGYDRFPLYKAQSLGLNAPEIITRTQSLTEYEAPTLRALELYARAGYDGPIGYFHTKGVSSPGLCKMWWRWIMNAAVLTQWKERMVDLETHELAGFCWEHADSTSHFCGNFWWTTGAWIRRLSGFDWYWANPWHNMQVEADRRYAAEFWISSNNLRGAKRRIRSVFLENQGNGPSPVWKPEWWESRPDIKQLAIELGSNLTK